MDRQDFTFPISTNNNNTKLSIDLEPWWCVTYSSSSSKNSENKEDGDLEDCLVVSRQSSCCGEKKIAGMKGDVKAGNYENDAENMDLLWEDFNDETRCRSCGLLADQDMSSRRMAESGCTGSAFRLAKAGAARMPSSGVLIKLMKKLLLHDNQPSLKRST